MKNFAIKAAAAVVSAALCAISIEALACSTIIVGKDVSKTGNIIVGHNEDNGGRILTAQYWVPAADHKAGEMIRYEPSAAEIPQVAHTYGFYWSQTYDPAGASFSDGFVNENGVVIVSNACSGIYDDDKQPVKDGGIGYGIRRLMAERATSARNAIDIAIELLGTYGYFDDGRTYTVADANEAWQLAIHQGNTWVARRVQDNEVVYIPNNFMMDKVDATDTKNVIVAPGMIERAIKNGRYTPKEAGVYKDFNFRKAVAPDERRFAFYNQSRNRIAWAKITGRTIENPNEFPYSFTPERKFGVEDVKAILRSHEDTIGDDPGWYHHNGFGLCRPTSHESVVYDISRESPLLIAGYRTLARVCETPYVPFYPLARPAEGTAFLDWQTALAEQFKGTPSNFSYDPDWLNWKFVEAANTLEYQRNDLGENAQFLKTIEQRWNKERPAVDARAQVLLEVSPEKAAEYLHAYNVRLYDEAAMLVGAHTQSIAPHAVTIQAEAIDPKSEKTVEMVVYGDETLDAAAIDPAKIHAGVGRASVGADVVLSDLAQPVAHTLKDVDSDGRQDLVLSFRQDELARYMIPGATYDVWFYGFAGEKRICAFDSVFVASEGYKGPQKRTRAHDM